MHDPSAGFDLKFLAERVDERSLRGGIGSKRSSRNMQEITFHCYFWLYYTLTMIYYRHSALCITYFQYNLPTDTSFNYGLPGNP